MTWFQNFWNFDMQLDKEIFLRGNSINLRPLNEEDINGNYAIWLNDPEVTEFNSHGRFPMTIEKLKEFVRTIKNSNSALVLAITDKESNKHIGNISLQGINWVDRNAEIAFLLGEKNFWGKGVMNEAGQLLIRHGFKALNLHRIHCGTSALNQGMQKLAVKLGMQQEGIRKEAIYKNGKYIDIIEYGIINPYEVL
jgi:[ribosomal protein S5]-alanine N-acetyltransferase